jgi:WD40 repeat protein
MVTGGEDATCRVWVIDHPDMAIALSDGYVQTALGASNDREQLLSCCHVLWGHETPISCLALSSDLDVAVSASLGGTICVHTVRRGNFIRSIYLGVSVRSIVLDSHGIFVAHTQDGFLHVYTINDVFLCSADAKEHLHDLKITSNGQILITGGDKGHVVVRSVHDLAVLSMLDLGRHGPIRCISLTPAELNPIPQFLFIGSDDGLVTIVDRDPHSKSEHFESEYVSFKL